MYRLITIVIFVLSLAIANAQTPIPIPNGGYVVYFKMIDNDTVPFIPLPTVNILPPKTFASAKEEIRYKKLVRNLKKVLPYAKIANTRLYIISQNLNKLDDPKLKKYYLKLEEEKLKLEFKDDITNLTMTQGRLLIKLIDRETGETSYELIKELRGSFSAFLYQGIAKLFGENLKENYDAKGEDKLIEEILIRIENGEL
ncbi:MAG: DUF4294 domain-containing protein [Bacteroidetes bacterium HGW-Bacteroidetes-21]|jgi:hypothetical protein|nr:MAG: DUF4294 domain-containing protein [Bacteroidetes bacterium HGW-Bacteroidetes-21]